MQIFSLIIISIITSIIFSFRIQKINRNQNRTRIRLPLTYYDEEYPPNCENLALSELHKPLYIVIWEKSEKAYKLIAEMEKQGLHTVFIPEGDLDIMRLTDDSMPMVYKEEILLESWIDIYAEMYPMEK